MGPRNPPLLQRILSGFSMSGPLVTVYLVNHNYGRFARQAVESVLAQTMQDFELLIIDDGSTDDSRDVLAEYSSLPNVVTIFQHNKGLNVTNNIALRSARGKYIMRLDADDWLDEHALQVLSGVLDREPEVGLVFPDYYTVDVEGRVLEMVRRHDFADVTLLDQPAHGACTMARRDLLREVGGYDESFRCQDGYDIWLKFIQKFDVKNVNLPLFFYRQHGSSLTRNENRILDTRARIIEKRISEKSVETSALAIVPVRGQVMDPRSQALRTLGGKPLIEWTIDAALSSEKVTDVLVTTPDERILDHVCKRYENRVILLKRDKDLAQVNSYLDKTLCDAADFYTKDHRAPDAIVALYVESPFRSGKYIDTAIDVQGLFETDCVVGVRPETDMFYRHDGHGLRSLRSGQVLRLEADELYREVGDLKVVSWNWLKSGGAIPGGQIGHVVLDQKASMSIMTEWDWEVSELLAQKALEATQTFRTEAATR